MTVSKDNAGKKGKWEPPFYIVHSSAEYRFLTTCLLSRDKFFRAHDIYMRMKSHSLVIYNPDYSITCFIPSLHTDHLYKFTVREIEAIVNAYFSACLHNWISAGDRIGDLFEMEKDGDRLLGSYLKWIRTKRRSMGNEMVEIPTPVILTKQISLMLVAGARQ